MKRTAHLLALLALASGCNTPDLNLRILDYHDLSLSSVKPLAKSGPYPDLTPEKPLTIDDAVAVALANNPEIGQAIARVRQAHAALRGAYAPFMPTLGVRGTGTHYFESGSSFDLPADVGSETIGIQRGDLLYSTGVDLNWNLFAGGRDYHNMRGARYLKQSARLQSDRVRQIIGNAVRRAFYLALLARDNIEIGNASVAFSARELRDVRARYEVGRGLKTDLLTFETRMLDAQVQVSEAENAFRIARTALCELMAIKLTDDVKLAMPEAGKGKWEQMPEDQAVESAWQTRDDLGALRRQYAAARRQVQSAKGGFYPQLGASLSYANNHRNSPKFSKSDDDVTGTLGVQWNLFEGGRTVSAVAQSRHAASETAEQFRQLKLKIRTEVSNARTNIRNARQRVELGEKTVASAEETLRLLTERYRAGAITISQVTEGELRLTEARQQLIKAKIDLLTAQSELKLAIGLAQMRE